MGAAATGQAKGMSHEEAQEAGEDAVKDALKDAGVPKDQAQDFFDSRGFHCRLR